MKKAFEMVQPQKKKLMLYHHTLIREDRPESKWYYDEVLKDKVWTHLAFYLVTHEISMQFGKDLQVRSLHVAELAPPNPENFIPFDKVNLRDMLRWVDKATPDMTLQQIRNVERLDWVYNLQAL